MTPRRLRNDCFLTDRERLTHAAALELIASRVSPVTPKRELPLDAAIGAILADDVRAIRPIPAHDNAAVDGYAFASADYDRAAGSSFELAGRAAAGHPFSGRLPAGGAVRILTGAVVPEGADTIAMQEDVELSGPADAVGATVRVPAGLKPGANRRRAGEDVSAGSVVVAAGRRLRPQDIAAIASTGAARVVCHAPLRVAVVSSGDEVLRVGEPFAPGKVYDANAPMLAALARGLGNEVTDLGILPDEPEAVRTSLADAASNFDLVLTSGGASQGDEDHLVTAVGTLGTRHLWQIAIKPGRPMSFGQIGDCVVLGLPGNPVAAFVCFLLYARPLIEQLSGAAWSTPPAFLVQAAFEITGKKPDRREFQRARLVAGPDGALVAERYERDGSGLISSLTHSDGLVEIPEPVTTVRLGDPVRFLPYATLGILG
ncbi:MAG: molybdopterin molybdenumtransferase MoeA [Rhizobiales bacterium]|nr:molybdopterin molybdenumtransferase MoeA [Hyphomicrobiales bacterium]